MLAKLTSKNRITLPKALMPLHIVLDANIVLSKRVFGVGRLWTADELATKPGLHAN